MKRLISSALLGVGFVSAQSVDTLQNLAGAAVDKDNDKILIRDASVPAADGALRQMKLVELVNVPGLFPYEPAGVSSGDITDGTSMGRALMTAADADTARSRLGLGTAAMADGCYVDVRKYGVVAGRNVSEAVRTANTAAIQAAVDAGGSSGTPVAIYGGPYEINDAILIRNHGTKIFGGAWNYEDNNKSRIVQTNASADAFKARIPVGYNSLHMVTLEDLFITGVGLGLSSGSGVNFQLDGPAGTVFSDFTNFRRMRIEGFRYGFQLAKFSNSSVVLCGTDLCEDGVRIGGNCNSVLFSSCQFSKPPSGGAALAIQGSGQVVVDACEYGNGGTFVRFEPSAIGMNMEVRKLSVENQQSTSVITTNNAVYFRNARILAGAYPSVVPFAFAESAAGALENIALNSFSAGIAVAKCTPTSIIPRREDSVSWTWKTPVEVYTDSTWSTLSFKYGFSEHLTVASGNSNAVIASEAYRGKFRAVMKPDSHGSQMPDRVEACVKSFGSYDWEPMTNAALRECSSMSGAVVLMVRNNRYRATGSSLQTFTLPTSIKSEDEIEVIAQGAGGVEIAQNTGQSIRFGRSVTTTGAAGKLILAQGDVVALKYAGANLFQVIKVVGAPTVR